MTPNTITRWLISADIFLDGKHYAEGVFKVYRVVHLNPSKEASMLRFQEVDIYVNRDQPT